MEELTPASLASLESTHVMDHYRYKLVRPAYGSLGLALWSVYPLADAQQWSAGFHPELRAWLELPGGRRLRLDVLHTTAPYGAGQLGSGQRRWERSGLNCLTSRVRWWRWAT